jgi:hypothetical protein
LFVDETFVVRRGKASRSVAAIGAARREVGALRPPPGANRMTANAILLDTCDRFVLDDHVVVPSLRSNTRFA